MSDFSPNSLLRGVLNSFKVTRLLPSPSLDAWHGSLGGRVHLSPFVSLHLSPVVSQPGCLARLGRVHLSPFVSLHLSPVVSQPECLSQLSLDVSQHGCVTAPWVDGIPRARMCV